VRYVSEDQRGNTIFNILLKVFRKLSGLGRHPYREITSNTTHICTGEVVPLIVFLRGSSQSHIRSSKSSYVDVFKMVFRRSHCWDNKIIIRKLRVIQCQIYILEQGVGPNTFQQALSLSHSLLSNSGPLSHESSVGN
jgi:hypothetical protein